MGSRRDVTDDEVIEMVERSFRSSAGTLFSVDAVFTEHVDMKAPMEEDSLFALFTAQRDPIQNGVWFYSEPHKLSSPDSACEQWFRRKDFDLVVGSIVIHSSRIGGWWVCVHAAPVGMRSVETFYEWREM